VVIGLAGGLSGAGLSFFAAPSLGTAVFGTELAHRTSLVPVSVLLAVLIAAVGSYLPIRRALAIRPAVALRGGK
jgi:putative ABC transport system permease protein